MAKNLDQSLKVGPKFGPTPWILPRSACGPAAAQQVGVREADPVHHVRPLAEVAEQLRDVLVPIAEGCTKALSAHLDRQVGTRSKIYMVIAVFEHVPMKVGT